MSLFFAILVNIVFLGLLVAAIWLKPRWLFISLAVIATVLMTIFFSWLYLLWAGLLTVVLFLALGSMSLFWRIVVGILGVIIVVGGFILTLPLLRGEAKNPIAINPVAENSVAGNQTAPQIDKNCTEAEVVESQTHGDKVLVDLNDGDPFDYSLTVVNPDFPAGNKTLVVLVEPMYIFDVVYPKMYFTSYRLRGTQEQAICSTMKIAGENAYAYVYVGNDEGPKGWTNPYLALENYWWSSFEEKQYSEEAITTGVESLPFQISTTDINRDLVSADVLHGQLWNPTPKQPKPGEELTETEKLTVVHPNVGEGYTLTVPLGWQGTYWTIADGNPELVQARIIQTSKEVVERDNVSINPEDYGHMALLYCGDPQLVPTTELKIGDQTLKWVTSLDGWVCKVTP